MTVFAFSKSKPCHYSLVKEQLSSVAVLLLLSVWESSKGNQAKVLEKYLKLQSQKNQTKSSEMTLSPYF